MTKEEARIYLEKWISAKTNIFGEHIDMTLPIVDEVVMDIETLNHRKQLEINQYSFKHLIKIAYDLKDN